MDLTGSLKKNIAGIFYGVVGNDYPLKEPVNKLGKDLHTLLGMNVGVSTFISDNGKTITGNNSNELERYFLFSRTSKELDGEFLAENSCIELLNEKIEKDPRFTEFKEHVENASKDSEVDAALLSVSPYAVKRSIEDASNYIIQMGIKISAQSSEDFEQGIDNIREFESKGKIIKPRDAVLNGDQDFSLFKNNDF